VHAVTVVHRAPSAAFRDAVPYALVLVDLDEGFRMLADVVGADPAAVAIGDRVRVVFQDRAGVALPRFTR
jgi:uncharacterized OB-fold protein